MQLLEMKQLEFKINELRLKLAQIVNETGLNSHETLNCSQKLDHYITIYQERKMNDSLLFPLVRQ
ncbi:aspartyl-phosphate phosphatase Spo0E family protein [Bacillus tuaregi]|uniref:aspartyl-phosphate phosphatase Spo0E family protein n=1 Tax=Bacillus tuaregi TaxID=1816695 RepID=UPI0008F81FB1|nr:aspartyl-phosphate phosphatase Spo0E family protein [Bacillus tuaregi]